LATRTETVYTYICDLCGSEHDDLADITPIYVDKPEGQARGMRDRRFQVDVCDDCLSRPIADVLAFCTGEHAGEVKPAAKRGVVRIADR
jgi:hypothetical protein